MLPLEPSLRSTFVLQLFTLNLLTQRGRTFGKGGLISTIWTTILGAFGRVGDPDKRVHPDDEHVMTSMTKEFTKGATSRVLRLPGNDTEWVPVHVTVNRVELEPDAYAGLISLRLPMISLARRATSSSAT